MKRKKVYVPGSRKGRSCRWDKANVWLYDDGWANLFGDDDSTAKGWWMDRGDLAGVIVERSIVSDQNCITYRLEPINTPGDSFRAVLGRC
jgi:hypothetical protein